MEKRFFRSVSGLSDATAVAGIMATVVVCFSPLIIHPGRVLFSVFSDLVVMRAGWQELIRKTLLEQGELPLWNPHVFCGTPFIANPGCWAFYPVNLVLVLLPLSVSTTLFILFHFWLGGTGVFLFLRKSLRFPTGPALAGALASIYSGKMLLHLLVPGHIGFLPMLWTPWAMLLIDSLVTDRKWRHVAMLAAVLGMMGLSLFTQLAFYSALLLTAYFLFRWWNVGKWKAALALRFCLAGLMAGLLCAVQLLPVIEQATQSARTHFMNADFASAGSLGWAEALRFLSPSSHHMARFVGDTFGWERTYQLGWFGFVLCVLGAAHSRGRKETWFFLLAAVAALLHALGKHTPVHPFLFHYVPGFGYFRVPSRSLFLLGFCLPPLIASGVLALSQPLGGKERKLLLCAALAGLVLAWLGWRKETVPPVEMLANLSPAALCLLFVGFACLGRRSTVWNRPVLATGGLLLEAAIFLLPFHQTTEFDRAFVLNGANRKILTSQFSSSERISEANRQVFSPLLPEYFLVKYGGYEVNGFNPMLSARYVRYLSLVTGKKPEPEVWISQLRTGQQHPLLDLMNLKKVVGISKDEITGAARLDFYLRQKALPRAFLVPRAKTVESPEAILEQLSLRKVDPRAVVLLEERGPPAAGKEPFREVKYEEYSPNRIRVNVKVSEPAYLFLSEAWHSGWECRDHGQGQTPGLQVFRANYLFRAVFLQTGSHELEFRFRPRSYLAGRTISVLAWAGLALFLGLACWFRTGPKVREVFSSDTCP